MPQGTSSSYPANPFNGTDRSTSKFEPSPAYNPVLTSTDRSASNFTQTERTERFTSGQNSGLHTERFTAGPTSGVNTERFTAAGHTSGLRSSSEPVTLGEDNRHREGTMHTQEFANFAQS